MSSSILTILDHVDKAIVELNVEIQRRSLRSTRTGLDKLTAFSDMLKSSLPEEFVETIFRDFDRHLHFIGYIFKRGLAEHIG